MIRNTRKEGKTVVIDLGGTLEITKQAKLKESLLNQLTPEVTQVVLSLKEVDFIDSGCLGALIAVTRMVREKGGDIRLACLNPEVLSIFQITRLDKIFSIFDQTSEAVSSFRP